MPSAPILVSASNGFAIISDLSLAAFLWLSLLLRLRHGFSRKGKRVLAPTDEFIYRSFERGHLRILAGWDNWSRHYLVADNEESDAFLRQFFARHCPHGTLRS